MKPWPTGAYLLKLLAVYSGAAMLAAILFVFVIAAMVHPISIFMFAAGFGVGAFTVSLAVIYRDPLTRVAHQVGHRVHLTA